MIRTAIAAAVLGTLAATSVAGTAYAGADREHWAERWEGTEAFGSGEGPCVPWAGSLHESRTGGYDLVTAPGGQVEGEFHVNGMVDGRITIVPDDPALPSYTGAYREKVNAIITGYDEVEGDLARVVQYRLRVPLTGTDGSRLVIAMFGKVTLAADGRTVVTRDSYGCTTR